MVTLLSLQSRVVPPFSPPTKPLTVLPIVYDSPMAMKSASSWPALLREDPRASVRAYIDATLTALVDQLALSHHGHPCITLRRRANSVNCVINPTNGALEPAGRTETYRSYSWPGSSVYESWKFTVILRVLAIIDQALHKGEDIYYIDTAYFRSQETVNGIIDDIAYTIGVDRAALNVEAAGKGLVAGCFRLRRDSILILDADSSNEDTMIPRIQEDDQIDISGARWVFIIEKEAVFHRLVRSTYHKRAIIGGGILVTGKGYPDLYTREFIRRLFDSASGSNQRLPRFYALVDGDPHGIAIMSTYKYGSLAHMHENARLSIPGLQWLGLRVEDTVLASQVSENTKFLPLTDGDRKKIITMLRNSPVWASNGPEPEWRLELQRMLMLNVKAEIEMLYERDGGLEGWIDQKIFRQD
ncbi:hypothetical protein N7462_003771 [Penicillium macrosclerotiorum]|uniref:uncharacterized protein n=1 Tax=Penicillium macrosclerotiorum TaxID=303699 RepID=UPI002547AD39|nr:uncharacterized protein N7462_003771 [Penicillium macrosclerotiorum]KAJ5689379.1 hypothetical protein N7462_003771 [Penicillium macrosclerotiorum]